MIRTDIHAGRTYVGRDGRKRTVTAIMRSGERPLLGYVEVEGNGSDMIGVSLDDFARWARKEIAS